MIGCRRALTTIVVCVILLGIAATPFADASRVGRVPATSASLQPEETEEVQTDDLPSSAVSTSSKSSCSCTPSPCDNEKNDNECKPQPCECDSGSESEATTILVSPSSSPKADGGVVVGSTDAEEKKELEEIAPPAAPYVPEPVEAPAVPANATDADVVEVVERTEAEKEAELDHYVQNYTSTSVEKMTDLIDRAFAEGAHQRKQDHTELAERSLSEEKVKDDVLKAEKMARLQADEATRKQQIKFRHDMDKFGADEAAKIEREENHKQNIRSMRSDRKQEESLKMDRILEIRAKQFDDEKARQKAWDIAEENATKRREEMDKEEKDLKDLIARQREKLTEDKASLGEINKKREDRVRTMADQEYEWEQEESAKTSEITMREETHKELMKKSEQSNKDMLMELKDDQDVVKKAREEAMKAKTNEAMEKSKVHEQEIKALKEKTADKHAKSVLANEQVHKNTQAKKKELTYEAFDAFKK